ncbi:MAG TPA: hypothetical protein VKT82_04375 [Ktedonobacterales bacterium]|nr:hypothetical protein [Ktedonobacterales bacterium]
MATTSKGLHRLVNSAIVLSVLFAGLLGLGLRANAASHTTITASHHAVADVYDPPPGH